MKVRQSLLGQADKCLRAAQYSVEQGSHFGASVRATGTGFHGGLEYRYLKRMEGTTASLADTIEMGISAFHAEIEVVGADSFTWDAKFPTYDSAVSAISFMLTTYVAGGHEWPPDWEVLGVELPFELPLPGGHTATSAGIDLVLRDPAGCIRGDDHKTASRMWSASKADPRKNTQGALYWGALRQMFPDAPGWFFTFSVITYDGKFQRFNCDPTEAHFNAVVDKAVQLATLIEGMQKAGMDLPANPASNLCSAKFCDFYSVCPHGAALEGWAGSGSLFLS